jgi:hypothetical protein
MLVMLRRKERSLIFRTSKPENVLNYRKRMGEASLRPYKNIEFLRADQHFYAGEVLHAGDVRAALEDLQTHPGGLAFLGALTEWL